MLFRVNMVECVHSMEIEKIQQKNIYNQQLSTLTEGDAELAEESSTYEQNRISSKGNPSLLSSGGTEILLGDQSLRQESR